MADEEDRKETGYMPMLTVGEAATAIGVAVAIIAGVLYATGTLATESYLRTLGFDANQFPSDRFILQARGPEFTIVPLIYAGCFLGLAAWTVVANRFFEEQKKPHEEAQKKLERKLRFLFFVIVFINALLAIALWLDRSVFNTNLIAGRWAAAVSLVIGGFLLLRILFVPRLSMAGIVAVLVLQISWLTMAHAREGGRQSDASKNHGAERFGMIPYSW